MSGGFGRGVRSFMDGALAGVDLRTKWDDRKRRQKIEDEEIEWRREDRRVAAEDRERRRKAEDEGAAWVREDRQYTRKARGIAESEPARTARTRDEADGATADAVNAAQA